MKIGNMGQNYAAVIRIKNQIIPKVIAIKNKKTLRPKGD
jgi:hypothetical protein